MAAEPTCPHCGKPVMVAALGGLCPECMIKAGAMETGEVGPGGTLVKSAPLPIPTIEELAPLFPQLEILACLGRGGMGAVYKARQPKLDRFVALKILSRKRESEIPDADFAERFQREAKALARLSHPDIVAIHDFGEVGGFNYLLMEYVDGVTLRQLLLTKKVSPEEALAIVPKICAALQFAHEHGIVHRDIKPENILIDKQGRVKIADFGIAKMLRPEANRENLTGAKEVIGTPHYMAPEQIERPQQVDHRADIYSLGVVFYEMLTGELPLGKFAVPSRKVQVDVRLDEVVLHALEKEPERRYQHASEVKSDVETISAGTAPRKSQTPHFERDAPAAKMERRRSVLLWYGFLVSLLVGLPVGLDLRLPYVWGLSIAGLVICSYKFGWLTPKAFAGAHPPGNASRANPPSPPNSPPWVRVIRWAARICGTLLLVFYGFFVLAEGLPPLTAQPEGVQLNFVALGLMLGGCLVGWKREGTAALLIASGWVLWQASEGQIRWNLFQTPLPVAALYAFCWWVTQGRRSAVVLTTATILAIGLGLGLLLLPTNVFVRGKVVDARTGDPLPGVSFHLLGAHHSTDEFRPNALSDAQGRFRLYVGWYATDKQLALSAPGYISVTTNLGPRPLGERQMSRDFLLQPAAPAPEAQIKAASVPPVVVATIPVAGSNDVDPKLSALRVRFSKPVHCDAAAWRSWASANLLELTGPPSYPDDRTLVLPVRLQPGRVYALWLNPEPHPAFRDHENRPAMPYLLVFQTTP